MKRRCVGSLKESIRQSRLNARLHVVENLSNAESLKRCFELGLEVGRELVYFVEDDWLHFPEAITEMVADWETFQSKMPNRPVAIHPYDDPDRYDRDGSALMSRIVRGGKRHYRTTEFSTQTFMIHKEGFLQNWVEFMGSTKTGDEEDGTNKVWRNGCILFSPIPSLAIHMNGDNPELLQDWQSVWNSTGDIEEERTRPVYSKLNLGCGEDILPGYENIDIRNMPGAVQADVRNLPYEAGTIEEIRAIDIYEHIPFAESEALLRHWVSLLEDGGKLIIQTPDVETISRWIGQAQTPEDTASRIAFLYGAQDYRENHHYTIGQKNLLEYYLRRAGIQGGISTEVKGTNLYVEAVK